MLGLLTENHFNPMMNSCGYYLISTTTSFKSGELIMLYMPREEGQGLVEYALILVLVAVVVIVILALLGPAIGNIFSNLVKNL